MVIRDPKHLKFIRSLPCCVCLCTDNVQAAHIRLGNDGGLAMKPSDCYTVPLCADCHHKQHSIGERQFWGDMDRVNSLAAKLYIGMKKARAIIEILRFNRVFQNKQS